MDADSDRTFGPIPNRHATVPPAPTWHTAIPSMLRAARRVLRCEHLAADAVQDALVHAWSNGRLEDAHDGALCCLAHLTSLEIRRTRGRSARREAIAAELATRSDGFAPDPAWVISAHECATRVRETIAELPVDCAEPLRRFLLDGESYPAIADRLAVPIGTVRSRIARARRILRERLSRDELRRAG